MNSTQIITLCLTAVIGLLGWLIYQNWDSLFKTLMILPYVAISMCAMYLICNTIGPSVITIAILLLGVMATGYVTSGENNRFNFKCSNIATVVVLVGLLLTSIFR